MAASDDAVVSALFQAPHEQFVSERQRLVKELKARGDKLGAAQLAKRARPPLSAWAVNQLWWQHRPAFEELFASAERLRQGDLSAAAALRTGSAKLRAAASTLLTQAGHPASEATLRRVSTNLAALAAQGGFAPDAPGALGGDREAPGFDANALLTFPGPSSPHETRATPKPIRRDSHTDVAKSSSASALATEGGKDAGGAEDSRARRAEALKAARAAEAAERRARAEEQARVAEERRAAEAEKARRDELRHVEQALAMASRKVAQQTRAIDELRERLTRAEAELGEATDAAADLEARRKALSREND